MWDNLRELPFPGRVDYGEARLRAVSLCVFVCWVVDQEFVFRYLKVPFLSYLLKHHLVSDDLDL